MRTNSEIEFEVVEFDGDAYVNFIDQRVSLTYTDLDEFMMALESHFDSKKVM